MNDQKSDLLGKAREVLEFAGMEANHAMARVKVELAYAYMALSEWYADE